MKLQLLIILLGLTLPTIMPAQLLLTNIYNIPDAAYSGRVDLTNVIIRDTVTNVGNFAFDRCTHLTNIVVGKAVTTIGFSAMATMERDTNYPLTNAVNVFFNGDAPTNVNSRAFDAFVWLGSTDSFYLPCNVTVYARPGTKGWLSNWGKPPFTNYSDTLAGRPVWYAEIKEVYWPSAETSGQFGFNVWGNTNMLTLPIVIERTDDLIHWQRLQTNTMWVSQAPEYGPCLTGFGEPPTNSAHFFRIRAVNIDWP